MPYAAAAAGRAPHARHRTHLATRAQDPYFAQRKLFPNVDFYSGIGAHARTSQCAAVELRRAHCCGAALKAMGIPVSMFTVLFAVARTVGWIAQWKEMIEDPHQKIGRPR